MKKKFTGKKNKQKRIKLKKKIQVVKKHRRVKKEKIIKVVKRSKPSVAAPVIAVEKEKRKPSIEKMYFTKNTQDAIVLYNKEEDLVKRNEIYNTKIKFSFEKLVENILNTFKFSYFDVGSLDTQKETVSHLVANMDKYEERKGKAFSYFSIIAKNYLIFHNNNNFKRYNQHVDITEEHEEHGVRLQVKDKHHDDVQTREFLDLMINFWDANIDKIFKKQRDISIANAVIELFRNIDRIDAFNKKALYLYIREISACKTQQITKVINRMKQYQDQIKNAYVNSGTISV
jgi:hypothetical protein